MCVRILETRAKREIPLFRLLLVRIHDCWSVFS